MTYTQDLATAVGQTRTLIGDPVVSGLAHFQDEELQLFLDLNAEDMRFAAADALDAWAASFATSAHDITIGDYRENTLGVAKAMRDQATAFRSASRIPAFAIANVAPDGPLGIVGRERIIDAVLAAEGGVVFGEGI